MIMNNIPLDLKNNNKKTIEMSYCTNNSNKTKMLSNQLGDKN